MPGHLTLLHDAPTLLPLRVKQSEPHGPMHVSSFDTSVLGKWTSKGNHYFGVPDFDIEPGRMPWRRMPRSFCGGFGWSFGEPDVYATRVKKALALPPKKKTTNQVGDRNRARKEGLLPSIRLRLFFLVAGSPFFLGLGEAPCRETKRQPSSGALWKAIRHVHRAFKKSSGDIPNSMRCSFSWNLVEPSWNLT